MPLFPWRQDCSFRPNRIWLMKTSSISLVNVLNTALSDTQMLIDSEWWWHFCRTFCRPTLSTQQKSQTCNFEFTASLMKFGSNIWKQKSTKNPNVSFEYQFMFSGQHVCSIPNFTPKSILLQYYVPYILNYVSLRGRIGLSFSAVSESGPGLPWPVVIILWHVLDLWKCRINCVDLQFWLICEYIFSLLSTKLVFFGKISHRFTNRWHLCIYFLIISFQYSSSSTWCG